jgi:peroxiredoxin
MAEIRPKAMTADPVRPTVGAASPDVDLGRLDGGRWRLADHAGRAVVLIFHRHIH